MKSAYARVLLFAVLLALLLPFCALAEQEETNVLSGSLPMLVNKDHPVGEDFMPADLVPLSDVLDLSIVRLKKENMKAVRTAAQALETMLEAARADGITNWQVGTAYRSYQDQVKVLEDKISAYRRDNTGWSRARARSAALKTVAEPGCSEHHIGLAFDMNVPGKSFKGTKQCTWLHEHCWEYGFIVRYQEGKESITGFTAEAWHIRYVGVEHSLYMRDNGMCLEEYIEAFPEVPDEAFIVEDIPLDELFAS